MQVDRVKGMIITTHNAFKREHNHPTSCHRFLNPTLKIHTVVYAASYIPTQFLSHFPITITPKLDPRPGQLYCAMEDITCYQERSYSVLQWTAWEHHLGFFPNLNWKSGHSSWKIKRTPVVPFGTFLKLWATTWSYGILLLVLGFPDIADTFWMCPSYITRSDV